MKHASTLSGSRLSPLVFALAAALALPPAFAQAGPTPPPSDTPSAPATNTPMHETTPVADAATAPVANTADADAKPATFKELDADKDGKLSRTEVAGNAAWTTDFEAADLDKDGYISKSEFRKHEADNRKTAKAEKKQH